MTERQLRLHSAGRWLFRCAALIGGVLGSFVFATMLTGQQRLVLAIMICALSMPVALIGLATAALRKSETGSNGHLGPLDVACLLGAAFTNAVLFVNPDAYLALALVAVSGALLSVGVQVAPHRSAGQLP